MRIIQGVAFGFGSLLWLTIPAPAAAPAQSYSIDQTRYFATPEAEQAELKRRVEEAAAFPSVAPQDPKDLAVYLHRAETLLVQLERHGAYLHLRASRDIDDQADADAADRTGDTIDRLRTSVAAALHALGGEAFAKDAAANPELGHYTYLLTLADHDLSHQLPADQQHVLDEVAEPAAANLWNLYEQTVRSTPFTKINTPDGELDARKDTKLLAVSPDRSIRQAAWQGRWDGYASRANIYASILLGVVRLNDRVARLQGFPDAPSKVYFNRGLGRDSVNEALATIESHADLLKSYQRMRAQHVAALTGIADVRPWDLSMPAPGFTAPRMTLDQTRVVALSIVAPLGKDYVEHFRQLLDPANGRLDVAAEQGKRTNGGFSIDARDVPTGLFVESYGAGLLSDTRVVVHEGGHAIHNQLMSESGVSPFYTRGPNWMFEAFATLNEFLLYDYLYRTSKDPQARTYYLEALIGDMTAQLFTSAQEGTLEQSIYDGVIAGHIRNAADLDALTLSIWSKYEIWPASEARLAHTWIIKSLMFEDPLYLVNYLYAGTLATKLFDMARRDPAAFRKRYADLLRHGFYAPPADLLRTFFGHDVSQHDMVEDDMRIVQQEIQRLAEIYKKH